MNMLHVSVQRGDTVGCVQKLAVKLFGNVRGFLVAQLVFQAGPEVHGDGADLYLHGQNELAFAQKHRHLHNQVQAAVAVWLGRGDVVARLYQPDIVLSGEQLADGVGIVEVGANHADARNVVQIVHCRLRGDGQPLAFELLGNALRAFDPAFHMMDRVAAVAHLELVVQNFQLGTHLPQRGLVAAFHDDIILCNIAQGL